MSDPVSAATLAGILPVLTLIAITLVAVPLSWEIEHRRRQRAWWREAERVMAREAMCAWQECWSEETKAMIKARVMQRIKESTS
jgi:hypothetical protein